MDTRDLMKYYEFLAAKKTDHSIQIAKLEDKMVEIEKVLKFENPEYMILRAEGRRLARMCEGQ